MDETTVLIESIANGNPQTKYAFTKVSGIDYECGDHQFFRYDIFDKPYGTRFAWIKNECGVLTLNNQQMDVTESIWQKCAQAMIMMDGQIQEQKKALDNIIFHDKYELKRKLVGDIDVYEVLLLSGQSKQSAFLIRATKGNMFYLNRPNNIPSHVFNVLIPAQVFENLYNHSAR